MLWFKCNKSCWSCDLLRSTIVRGVQPSTINTTDSIYCFGGTSCEYSTMFNSLDITCAGGFSCPNSIIHTEGSGDIYQIRFIGYDSGRNVNITCQANDECYIWCDGISACNEDTRVLCDGTCHVFCDHTANGCPNIQSNNPTEATANPSSYPTIESTNPTAHPWPSDAR
eukprot:690034_1